MIISTMNDLPGYEITDVIGEVFGLDGALAQRRFADGGVAKVTGRWRS